MSRTDTSAGMGSEQQGGEQQANLSQTAAQVGQNIRDIGSQVRDQAGEKYEQFRDQAGEYYEQGRQRAMEMEQGLEQYVQEKPIQALLIAAGVGLLLGMLWKRG
jgi:ElaB/YqjD/DUF883 family membrane-anchored ribosome-binding protein